MIGAPGAIGLAIIVGFMWTRFPALTCVALILSPLAMLAYLP